ncbi:hypothetical protein [Sutcliffiella horikoshii]|uniref:hypothetical protein n=1 Tax=Sutcliffiella horikoshii TaxID=79883 RepID=UPI001CFCAF4E|nr:hypothetical protein [Sutcliffiella horikoshii]
MREVESTNLSGETIDGIELGMDISNETFQQKYGRAKPDPDNQHYSAQGRKYDQYWINGLLLGVDRETNEILSIGRISNHPSSAENRVELGDSMEKVILEYGDHFYTYNDSQQSISVIGYVDHSNNLHLSINHSENRVIGISLSYAFDRLLWEK